MYRQKELCVDENQREILQEVTWEFPYFNTGIWLSSTRRAPWHWHPAFEIVYIVSGTALYKTPQAELIVPPDGILFINSGVFHSAETIDNNVPVEYRCQLVEPNFLAGGSGSLIYRKYVDPIVQCTDLPYTLILPGDPMHAEALALLRQAIAAAEAQDLMYEYRIQQNLSHFWLMFAQKTMDVWLNSAPKNDARSDRVKQMLAYIQNNSAEKLTLDDIAASAGISTRECLRCFQNTLKITPFEYLIDCRVRRAADMLISSTESITNIALSCGFSSSSYFCRIFKKVTGHSPSEYKKLLHSTQK